MGAGMAGGTRCRTEGSTWFCCGRGALTSAGGLFPGCIVAARGGVFVGLGVGKGWPEGLPGCQFFICTGTPSGAGCQLSGRYVTLGDRGAYRLLSNYR